MRFVILLLVVFYCGAAGAETSDRSISVSATGTTSAVPDMATLRIGVTREAATAKEAMSALSSSSASVLQTVEASGIAAEDVQTSGLSLNPVWDQRNARPLQVRGYVASMTLTVRVHALDTLGSVLDRLVGDGANTLNGLQFSVAEPAPHFTRARRDAVEQARTKAETLAAAAGVSLGPILQINEGSGSLAPAPMARGAMMEASSLPIASGELDFSVTVSMVYAIE